MSLKDLLASDLIIFANQTELAEAIVYNGVPSVAILERGAASAPDNLGVTSGQAEPGILWIISSEIFQAGGNQGATELKDPQNGDRFTTSEGAEWQVVKVLENQAGTAKLACIKTKTASVWGRPALGN